jgi:hypothetical protein
LSPVSIPWKFGYQVTETQRQLYFERLLDLQSLGFPKANALIEVFEERPEQLERPERLERSEKRLKVEN